MNAEYIPGLTFTGTFVSVPEVENGKPMPVYHTSLWLETIEGWNVFAPMGNKELRQAVKEVYNGFDSDVQLALMHTPDRPGGWVDRARFWKSALRAALDLKLYHMAMEYILDWYVHRFTQRPTLHVAAVWGAPEVQR